VASTIPNIDYTLSGANYLYVATVFTATGGGCGNDNVYYKLSITPNAG
jgi:hypothetical protein